MRNISLSRVRAKLVGDPDTLNTLFDSEPSGIVIIDENANILGVNKAAEDLLRISAEEAENNSISMFTPKVFYNYILMFKDFKAEFYFPRIDKYIMTMCTILKGTDGIKGSIIYFQDVTPERKTKMELKAVKENENELKNLIEASYDGIYITDCNGLTLYVNKSHERISGIKATELIGKYMQEIVNDGLVSRHITSRVVSGKAPITVEQTLVNGKKVVITGSPIFGDDGKVRKVITNVRDITELIELEKDLKETKEIAERLKSELLANIRKESIVCESASFQTTLNLAKRVASKDETVLILGETGAGKEVIAKYIHSHSNRKNSNYVKINCGAIPANLLESELFGYVNGAFTGAKKTGKIGMFELANNGTIFLDEIGELPINLQASLLRVLQEGEIIRIGDSKSVKVNVRVIAATNRNLEKMIEEGTFRLDLYYRINVISITVPPLRERKDDIPGLAELFIDKLNNKYNEKKTITLNFINYLKRNEWSGNVRELENFITKQYIMSDDDIIDKPQLGYGEASKGNIEVNGLIPLKDAYHDVEAALLKRALEAGKTTYKAADLLQVSQPTFCRKYKEIFGEEKAAPEVKTKERNGFRTYYPVNQDFPSAK